MKEEGKEKKLSLRFREHLAAAKEAKRRQDKAVEKAQEQLMRAKKKQIQLLHQIENLEKDSIFAIIREKEITLEEGIRLLTGGERKEDFIEK